MSNAIAALPSPTAPIAHESVRDDLPETRSIAFSELWQDKDKGLTFGDVLDIINPLQHIPVISTIYRMVTGDEIGVGARIAGGALFGGPLGAAAAGMIAGLEQATGGSVEQHVASLFGFEQKSGEVDQAQLAIAPEAATAAVAAALSSAPRDVPFAAFPARTPPPALPRTSAHPAENFQAQPAAAQQAPPPSESASKADLARRIAAAQRAQAGLLAASLQADGVQQALSGADEKSAPAEAGRSYAAEPLPFRNHPYMLPRNAPSSLVVQTMERALQRYHQGAQRQATAAPAAR